MRLPSSVPTGMMDPRRGGHHGMATTSTAPGSSAGGALERYFRIHERGSSVGAEVRGGVTTFIVMAYILIVNPVILSTLTRGQGPDFAATATMTALAAGVCTLAMGLYANYPFALASGLGLNAIV